MLVRILLRGTAGTLHHADIWETLGLQPIHGALDALRAVWSGQNHVELTREPVPRHDHHRQSEVLNFFGRALGALFALESSHPHIARRMVVYGRSGGRLAHA